MMEKSKTTHQIVMSSKLDDGFFEPRKFKWDED